VALAAAEGQRMVHMTLGRAVFKGGFRDQPPPPRKSVTWQFVLIIELSSEKHALQNIENDCYEGLSDSCRVHQIRFRPGLRPDPAEGAHDAPYRPPNRLRRGTPPPHSTPPRRVRRLGLVACGDSSSAPSAPRSQNPLRIFFLDAALTLGCVLCTVTCSGEPPRVLISSLLVRLRVRCDNILINRHTMYMKTSYKEWRRKNRTELNSSTMRL